MALAQRNTMSVTAAQQQTGIASLDRFLEHCQYTGRKRDCQKSRTHFVAYI